MAAGMPNSNDDSGYDDLSFIPTLTNRLNQPIDFEEFLSNKSAFFEIAGEDQLDMNLENDEEEKKMKKIIIESQLKWNENLPPLDVASTNGNNLDHLEAYGTLARSMVDVKIDGSISSQGRLKKRMIKRGCGPNASKGDLVWVHYQMYVEHGDEPIDDTFALGSPKRFTVGNGEVIAALDNCIAGMNEGQTDHVLASYHHAFGPMGCPPRILPETEVLVYITLVQIHFAGTEVPIEDLSPEERRDKGFIAILKAAEKRKKIGNDFFKRVEYVDATKEYSKAQELANELIPTTESESFQKDNLIYSIQGNLAMAYLAQDKFRKAVMHCNEALATPLKDSMKTKAYYSLSKALFEMGKLEDAEKNIKRAHELNCNDPHITDLYEKIKEERTKRFKQEREMAQRMFGKLNLA